MRVVNLTPDDVRVTFGGKTNVYRASGQVARVIAPVQDELAPLPDGSPVFSVPSVGRVVIPAKDVHAVIVTLEVAETLQQHQHLGFDIETGLDDDTVRILVPDRGPMSAIRNAKGEMTSVRRLLDYGTVPYVATLPPRKRKRD